ncbi:helix-turn-helix domain-containing protein [Mycetocola reblochoni]|uniref:Cys-tRNA(Pro) deacylase YbaK n=2 Tax=Mycetocola reblochoni TaxID=331618 RepID=A0A1R4JAP0_9MICO|nr:XRE family transcriptional regulator [Mycetocola reblochoni]RLP70029.1 XRE family transcriptional regulator [Mycetocola reblochoni]SJN29117.1 Cys-tRNA(Pro) deacylase YbaK [Mycetocola reblochoni REB411]
MGALHRVGGRLREARVSAGLTLDELSARTRISTSTLSRLEAGKRQASLELVVPVAAALDLSLDVLVRDEQHDPRVRRTVTRRDGHVIAPLTHEQSPVHSYKISYPPGTEPPKLRSHDGHEWLYVLSGRLRLRVGDADVVLGRGEAAEFDTRLPHAMHAVGSSPAQVISMFNETGERMHLQSLGE